MTKKGKRLVRISEVRMREILTAGQMMSNICFNLAQRDSIPADVRKSMKECQQQWDSKYPKIVNGKVEG